MRLPAALLTLTFAATALVSTPAGAAGVFRRRAEVKTGDATARVRPDQPGRRGIVRRRAARATMAVAAVTVVVGTELVTTSFLEGWPFPGLLGH